MSALPSSPRDTIPSQDETHIRVHELLSAVTAALLQEQPGLRSFHDHRPERDRSSGGAWHGLQTFCHVSALLASDGAPEPDPAASCRLLEVVEQVVRSRGMSHRSTQDSHGIIGAGWGRPGGDLLEVVVSVKVTVRMISSPFLPGSLDPIATTSPTSAISPVTPPPRLVR